LPHPASACQLDLGQPCPLARLAQQRPCELRLHGHQANIADRRYLPSSIPVADSDVEEYDGSVHAIRATHAFDGERFLDGGVTVLVEGARIIGVEPYGAAVPHDC